MYNTKDGPKFKFLGEWKTSENIGQQQVSLVSPHHMKLQSSLQKNKRFVNTSKVVIISSQKRKDELGQVEMSGVKSKVRANSNQRSQAPTFSERWVSTIAASQNWKTMAPTSIERLSKDNPEQRSVSKGRHEGEVNSGSKRTFCIAKHSSRWVSSIKKSSSTESNSTHGPTSGGQPSRGKSRNSSCDTNTPSKQIVTSGGKRVKGHSTIKLNKKQIHMVGKNNNYQQRSWSMSNSSKDLPPRDGKTKCVSGKRIKILKTTDQEDDKAKWGKCFSNEKVAALQNIIKFNNVISPSNLT